MIEELDKNKSFLKDFMEKAYEYAKELDDLCNKVKKTDVSKLSNDELKGLFVDYIRLINNMIAYTRVVIQLDMLLTDRLKAIIKKKVGGEEEFQKYFLLFSSSSKIGFFEQENQKLVKLLGEIKKNKELTESLRKEELSIGLKELFKEHLEEFSWLGNMDYNGKFWDEGNLITRLKDMIDVNVNVKLKGIKEMRENREKDVKEAVKELNLTEEEVDFIEGIRELVYFRTFRLDVVFRSAYFVKNLFEEIAQKMDITYKELLNLFPQEIEDFLDGKKIDGDLIEERKKDYAFFCISKKAEVLYGEDIKKAESEVQEEIIELEEIKGSVASQGKVQGEVKIIDNASDLPKINKGDVLVASMTKPDYIIAMEKAAAFVTDEGGITCHAAIVAREMNKPCIIGTKVATKVLKDGDLVEVDAEKGVVRKIK